MEYIFTDLPRYIRVTSRTEFSSSVVQSGSVLLFSEDGSTLTAKLPDGSFITVGGSGGTDVSSTTAQAADVLSSKLFYNSGGTLTTGTIPTVSASVESGAVVVPAGYIPTSQSFPVSSGTDVSSTTAEAADVLSGKVFYNSGGTQTSGTIPTVSASVESGVVIVPSGYIASSQSFPVSSGGAAMNFYRCASVYDATFYRVSGAGTTDCNGDYYDTGLVVNNQPLYSFSSGSQTWYLFFVPGSYWCIHTEYQGIQYGLSDTVHYIADGSPTSSWSVGIGNGPAPSVSTETGTASWSGKLAVYDSVTGAYSYSSSVTSGLPWDLIKPQTGKTYTSDAMIEAKLYTGIPLNGLDFYLPFDNNMNDQAHGYTVDTSEDHDNEFSLETDNTGPFLRCNKQSDGYGYISWPSTANQYQYGTGDFSVSFWLRAPGWDDYGNQIILCKKSDDGSTGICIGNENYASQGDNIMMRCAYELDLHTTAVVSNSGWVHWCFVRTSGVGYWYRNGTQNSTGTEDGSATSSEPFNIGYYGAGWSCTAKFDLKALRVYNRALTAAEVAALSAEFA